MMSKLSEAEAALATAALDLDDIPGLCRVCGRTVPRAGDPTSCTPSLCSEECLGRAIVAYWAAHGLEARVSFEGGFARLEGLRGVLSGA
jgi:hypothetical protein